MTICNWLHPGVTLLASPSQEAGARAVAFALVLCSHAQVEGLTERDPSSLQVVQPLDASVLWPPQLITYY